MRKEARSRWSLSLPVFAGLLWVLTGCATTVSSGGPAPTGSPGRGYKWGHGQPRLVVIAGTGISYVADCDEDIYALDNVWYRYSGGVWFSCRSHGGNWTVIDAPPPAFSKIPPGHAKFHKVDAQRSGPPAKGAGPGHGQGQGRNKRK